MVSDPVVSDAVLGHAAVIAELAGVTKVYRTGRGVEVPALQGVDLTVRKGELLAVVGPSGSGKSTLLHLLGCLDRPTAGRIAVLGTEVTALSPSQLASFRRRHIGFVFQQHHLVPSLTALQNAAIPLRYRGASRRESEAVAREWLERLGMGSRLNHYPSELSGGEQQRVGIARALVARPDLVLADEPTGDLDSASTEALLKLIAELNAELGQTFVIVTHDARVASFCSRQVQIQGGVIEREPVT